MKPFIFFMVAVMFLANLCFAVAGDKIFYEDFSSYGDGELPPGWIGGDTLGVREVNRKKVLRNLVNGSYDITTNKIDLSGNFRASIIMKHYFHNEYKEDRNRSNDSKSSYRYSNLRAEKSIVIHFGDYQIWIGDGVMIAGMKDKWPDWQEQEVVEPDKTFVLSLTKEGSVYSVYLNNTKILVGRFPDVKISNIRFASQSKFEIDSISVDAL